MHDNYEFSESLKKQIEQAKKNQAMELHFRKTLMKSKYKTQYLKAEHMNSVVRMSLIDNIFKTFEKNHIGELILLPEINQLLSTCGVVILDSLEHIKLNASSLDFQTDVVFCAVVLHYLDENDIALYTSSKSERDDDSEVSFYDDYQLSQTLTDSIRLAKLEQTAEIELMRCLDYNYPNARKCWERLLINPFYFEDTLKHIDIKVDSLYNNYQKVCETLSAHKDVSPLPKEKLLQLFHSGKSGTLPIYRGDYHSLSMICAFEELL